MGKLRRAILLSFRTKVLVPVVAVMVLLIAVTNSLVNRRVTAQLQTDAAKQLAKDEAIFKSLTEYRKNHLFLRYNNLKNEPRFKAAAMMFDPGRRQFPPPERQVTLRGVLDELIKDGVADVIVFATEDNAAMTVVRNPRLNVGEFEAACAGAINQAISGQPKVDLVKNGDRLYDIVTVPISVNDNIVGAMAFGAENSVAQEFHQFSDSELVLLSDGRPMAATLQRTDLQPFISEHLTRAAASPSSRPRNPIGEIITPDEHFLYLSGSLSSEGDPHGLGYLIVSSYEKALQTLHETQRLILQISAVAILCGAAIVWFLVRKVTEPLQELHDSVEAVGKGDLTRRIEVSSMDECGELAEVFNQMTENLRFSREQLEATVERLKTTQAQLIQSEKLSGIGEFVAGVTHELNNPLTSVLGFSELLVQADTDPQHRRYLDMIHKSAQRCHKIVQSLLSFARRHQPERKPVCVNSLIEAALEILQYQLRTSNIEVVTNLDPNLPQAMVDPHQIQQVFLNLVNNARQAIEAHHPKGSIKITTSSRGSNVRVTIQDSGPGISEENLSKIFDPFFTTKDVGKGTGLGLSLCYGIIKEHGGTITPRCRPGEGATFITELPITYKTGDPDQQPRLPETDTIDPKEGAGKKVLVIDDEEPILQMVSDALTCRGYHVDTALDGETGLRRLRQTNYDVTLCDWKMPGLNGREVYDRLRARNPEVAERMVFITGDVVSEHTRRFFDEQKRVCLAKPFTLAEFRSAISKVLAAQNIL